MVSPMVMSSMPARQTMSPAIAASISTRLRPSNANSLVTFVGCTVPSSFITDTASLSFTRPVKMRPIGDAAKVVARVEVGHEQLQAVVHHAASAAARARRWRRTAAAGLRRDCRLGAGHAVAGVGVEHRELDLVFGRVEVDEEVVDLVQHFLRPRVRPVDLVHHDDRRQAALERLAQHEAGLRQRPFRGVHEQDDAVHHRQRALDFPPKSAWPGVSQMLMSRSL